MEPFDQLMQGEILPRTVPPAVKPLSMPRIGFNISGGYLHTSQFIHPYDGLKNLTETALNGLMPPMPTWEEVKLRHLVIVGAMESGKTSYARAIAKKVGERYKDYKVNTIFTDDIETALDNINKDPVQLIIIDDAVKKGSSRQGMSNKRNLDIGNFLEIRHVYERVAKVKTGIVVVVYLTQRFKMLDIVFRSGHILIFKSTSTDANDEKLMKEYVTGAAYAELGKISYRMFLQHDNSAKSDSIVAIPIGGDAYGNDRPCGRFHLDYVSPDAYPLVKIGERPDGDVEFFFDREIALADLLKEKNWKKKARAYFLSVREPDLTQSEIALKVKYANQAQVSKAISEVRGEICRRSGLEFEKYMEANLLSRGFEARRLGGDREPDILATSPKGLKSVYSCKCLDFDKPYRMAVRGDQGMNPELKYISDPEHKDAALYLSVYNFHVRDMKSYLIDLDKLGEVIEIPADLKEIKY
ncbi:MAG: AAA family ATPase [Methanomassiliicoccus sp.]|nr:AAA family ATPase [Methanomassiliicoccus sp.]